MEGVFVQLDRLLFLSVIECLREDPKSYIFSRLQMSIDCDG